MRFSRKHPTSRSPACLTCIGRRAGYRSCQALGRLGRRQLSGADQDFNYKAVGAKGQPLRPIPYKELDLHLAWQSLDIAHELTTKGIQKFVADYRSIPKPSA